MKVNIIIDVVSIAMVIVVAIGNGFRTKSDDKRIFIALIACVISVLCFDTLGWLLDGKTFKGARLLLYIVNSIFYVLQITYCYLWTIYGYNWNFGKPKRLKLTFSLFAIPFIVEMLAIAVNPFISGGLFFSINELNKYVRTDYYLLNHIPYFIYIFAVVIFTVYNAITAKDVYKRRRSILMSVFMVLPILGTIYELFYYGVSLLWPFTALSLLMVYVSVQQQNLSDERVNTVMLENELSQMRVSIMLSQIQPHFLFNSLTAISHLCEKQPAKAKQAIIKFSQYLRGNIDSLQSGKLVLFEQELKHIQIYLELEQMRFSGELRVAYDIKATGFYLPPLTIQPLVENAVKHGIGQKEGGGTVTISTAERDDCFVITITDDGVGFDKSATHADGKTHIGIDNVKNRLSSMQNSSLEIESQVNIGTTATIRILKEAL